MERLSGERISEVTHSNSHILAVSGSLFTSSFWRLVLDIEAIRNTILAPNKEDGVTTFGTDTVAFILRTPQERLKPEEMSVRSFTKSSSLKDVLHLTRVYEPGLGVYSVKRAATYQVPGTSFEIVLRQDKVSFDSEFQRELADRAKIMWYAHLMDGHPAMQDAGEFLDTYKPPRP